MFASMYVYARVQCTTKFIRYYGLLPYAVCTLLIGRSFSTTRERFYAKRPDD